MDMYFDLVSVHGKKAQFQVKIKGNKEQLQYG